MPNRLIQEKSPYLLQHAHNPVNWCPWGREAFAKAKKENKPVLVSIGYSTCHWCHVMAHESFEDEKIARLLNERFVAIKVDREERPDIDTIYMKVCQALTGQGGWPLNVFLTPDQKPFYAGTYFPKESRFGLPGFKDVLLQLHQQYTENPEKITNIGKKITQAIQKHTQNQQKLDDSVLNTCFSQLEQSFDPEHGGFGEAPKFPSTQQLTFLLMVHRWKNDEKALLMATKTLDAMAAGGIYDHIGFGFARYAVDEKWLVPHFEKMLYDQAMLSIVYTEAYQITKKEDYRRITEEILDHVRREMHSPDGGFYSAEDADSEGEEGKFYLWERNEVLGHLGEKAGDAFCTVFDITEEGNFEGKNIPNLIGKDLSQAERATLEASRERLFQIREKRVHPYKDDKILTSWNALMVVAFAKAGRVFQDKEYLLIARKALHFIENQMIENSRLMARYRDGEVKHQGFIDDYANLLWAYIEMYESCLDVTHLQKAINIADQMIVLFWDREKGGFYFYGHDSEVLISRPKELYDAAIPSGNSVAAMQLFRLSKLTGNVDFEKKVSAMFSVFADEVNQYPRGYCAFLQSFLMTRMDRKEVVILKGKKKDHNERLVTFLQRKYWPEGVYLVSNDSSQLAKIAPFTKNFQSKEHTTVYICENFNCRQPTTDIDNVLLQLQQGK